jgi:kynurenine formamidase
VAAFDESALPDELTATDDRPKDTTWGLFGERYKLGTLNFLTPERVKAAAALVRTGKRFNLNLPLNRPVRADESGLRGRYRHEYVSGSEGVGAGQLDERLDNFNTQTSTQWDGFGHVKHPRFGFYNGVKEGEVKPGDDSKHSIGSWTEAGGLVGRGVLLDVERYCIANGIAYDSDTRIVIPVEMVEAVASWEHVELKPGDILLLRTGSQRSETEGRRRAGSPGLGPGREVGAFLWQKRIAAVAADTSAFDPSPIDATGPRSMHMQMVPMLGMPIGELFALDELAEDCAVDGVYEFMFVSVPLNLPGGIASPPNAIAIK